MKICNTCHASKPETEFAAKRAQCKDCRKEYMKQYNIKNAETISEQKRAYFKTINKKERYKYVKAAVEKSYESFLRYQMHHITKYSNYKKSINGKLNPAALEVNIDYDYLLELWHKQHGCCVLSGLPMSHKSGSLYTISIDRIDSVFGYLRGNVQLVCQFMNLAKNSHSNQETIDFLNKYFYQRLAEHERQPTLDKGESNGPIDQNDCLATAEVAS